MDTKKARKVLAETRRRAKEKDIDLGSVLFGPQRAFADDQARLVAACCSRRAGKSFGLAARMMRAALKYPRSLVPYITLTREDAKNIIWPAFAELDQQFSLGLRFRENTGDVVFRNGSKVIMRGASTRREIEKLRGPKYPMAVIDEAQGFPPLLFTLIDEVLEPATMDYQGQIYVTGTPGAACAGPFHQIITDKRLGWSTHHWTLQDNPHLPHAKAWLKKLRERRGWTETTPAYVREYRGVWVRDATNLVFAFDDKKNMVRSFSDVESSGVAWSYILGVDLGFNDPTAFVVLAYSEHLNQAVVVESYKESGLIPSAVAAHVEQLRDTYNFDKIVADTGGFGKGYAEELKQKHGVPVEPAQKTKKNAYIEHLNGDFRRGGLKIAVNKNTEMIDEIRLLQWDIDTVRSPVPKVDDARFDDHLCDALLYAWRECRHQDLSWEIAPPKPGSPQAIREYEDALEAEVEEQHASVKAYWEEGWVDAHLPDPPKRF